MPFCTAIRLTKHAKSLKTREDTAYCVRLWDTWAESKAENVYWCLSFTTCPARCWLSMKRERIKDGMEYTPNTFTTLIFY